MDLTETFTQYVIAALSLCIPVLVIAVYFRRQLLKRRPDSDLNGPIRGTKEEREQAEAELKEGPFNPRERLLEDHRLYDRFSSLQGFSDTYMADLTRLLDRNGIKNGVVFQETLPVGMGEVLTRQGVHELYVDRDEFARADQLIRDWKKTRG